MYNLIFLPSVKKDLLKIQKDDREKIYKKLEQLEKNPFVIGTKKLAGYKATYRIRQGNYRIIYSVKNNELIIEILKIKHRKNVYK